MTALIVLAAPVAAQDAAPAKVSNIVAPSLAAEPGAFLKAALERPAAGRCEVLSPDPFYVKEMLVDVATLRQPEGPRYERRVALVVGAGAYRHMSPLANPPNDAAAMARLFRALGFTVYRAVDAGAAALDGCLSRYYADLSANPADVAVFFYAGHGAQLTGAADGEKRNYMLAVDARVENGKGLGFTQIDGVLREMRAHAKQAVFLYDACRNAPFAEGTVKEADGAAVRQTALEGAAEVKAEDRASQAGLFIAYATSPGKTADDSWGATGSLHSPFTKALLTNLAEPGVVIEEALANAYYEVGELTSGRQTPWTSSSLQRRLRLNGTLRSADVAVKSADFAGQSLAAAEAGARGSALAAALKGLPANWIDDARARAFTDARLRLFQAMHQVDIALAEDNYPLLDVALSPDGATAVTAGEKTAVWDAQTGRKLRELPFGSGRVQFSPNGSRIAVGDVVYDPKTFDIIATLSDPERYELKQLAFSGDGSVIFTLSAKREKTSGALDDGVIEVWSARTGARTRIFDESARKADGLAISADGRRMLVGFRREVKLFDVRTGKSVLTLNVAPKRVRGISFGPDGPRALVSNDVGGDEAAVLNVDGGGTIFDIPSDPDVDSWALSADGRLVAAASRGTIALFRSGVKVIERAGESGAGLAFFGTNRLVESSTRGVRILRVDAPVVLQSQDATFDVRTLTFSGDSARLATSHLGSGEAGLWRADDGAEIARVPASGDTFFNADGSRLAQSSTDSGNLWDVSQRKIIAEIKGRVFEFSPDGRRGVSAAPGGAMIWSAIDAKSLVNLDRAAIRRPDEMRDAEDPYLSDAAISPDGARVATAASNCVNKIWDAKTGKEIAELKWRKDETKGFLTVCLPSQSIAFSDDGAKILSFGFGAGTVWDAMTGAQIATIAVADEDITAAVFSPDAARVLASTRQGIGRIWNAATGAAEIRLAGKLYEGPLGFSADGRLAFGDSGVWDAATGVLLVRYGGGAIDISPDMRRIAETDSHALAKIWPAPAFGPKLVGAATRLLAPDVQTEIERDRMRYWVIDPALLR